MGLARQQVQVQENAGLGAGGGRRPIGIEQGADVLVGRTGEFSIERLHSLTAQVSFQTVKQGPV